jgi:hypothetical protein
MRNVAAKIKGALYFGMEGVVIFHFSLFLDFQHTFVRMQYYY